MRRDERVFFGAGNDDAAKKVARGVRQQKQRSDDESFPHVTFEFAFTQVSDFRINFE